MVGKGDRKKNHGLGRRAEKDGEKEEGRERERGRERDREMNPSPPSGGGLSLRRPAGAKGEPGYWAQVRDAEPGLSLGAPAVRPRGQCSAWLEESEERNAKNK